MIRLAGFAALVTIVGSFDMPALAQPKKSDAYVKVTAKADKPDADGKQTITVTVLIDKGWHIYANPVGEELLKSVQTVVTVTGKEKLQNVKVEYPAGKLIKDEVIGEWRTYEGKVEIKAHVQRAKGDAGPLEVRVKILAVPNNGVGRCLLPATAKALVE